MTGTVRKSGSTGAVRTSPIKKVPDVSAESLLGSEDNGVIGQEFRQAAILVRNVYISLYVNTPCHVTLVK